MSLLIVTPVIRPPEEHILESWDHRPHLTVINGAHDLWQRAAGEFGLRAHLSVDEHGQPTNAGCPASWNFGFRLARDEGIEYVAITSQSLYLRHGTSRLAELVGRCADDRGLLTGWSFHCAVFAVGLWERIGGFDEDLPIFCDMDFTRRLYLAGERTRRRPMPGANLSGTSSRAASVFAGLIPAELYEEDRGRFEAKWGCSPDDPVGVEASGDPGGTTPREPTH